MSIHTAMLDWTPGGDFAAGCHRRRHVRRLDDAAEKAALDALHVAAPERSLIADFIRAADVVLSPS